MSQAYPFHLKDIFTKHAFQEWSALLSGSIKDFLIPSLMILFFIITCLFQQKKSRFVVWCWFLHWLLSISQVNACIWHTYGCQKYIYSGLAWLHSPWNALNMCHPASDRTFHSFFCRWIIEMLMCPVTVNIVELDNFILM